MKPKAPPPDSVTDILVMLGLHIEVARRRRGMSMKRVCEGAMITEQTYSRLIKGEPGVSTGVLGRVLHTLNMEESLRAVANPATDEYGIALEVARVKGKGGEVDETYRLDTNF